MEEVCRRCNKPKQRKAAGSITQWIALCDCENLKSAQTEEMQKLSLHICADCGKRIVGKERSGSFTQWVFRSDVCCCSQPRLESVHDQALPAVGTGDWLAGRLRSQEQKNRERALKEIDPRRAPQGRALIDVDPTLFPQDRYVALDLLGAGAEGNVYLCCDLLLCKNVAVKTLHVLNAQQLMAFQQEARATSRLNHPNIVTTLDFGATDEGKPYMVMELSSGVSLAQYLEENGPLSEELAVVLFEKICLALQYAHDKGVYHRDLKPSNFLIFENAGQPDVQVIDFGIAQIKHERQEPTIVQGRTVAGTPAYMSPDQVRGLVYDARSEIYALGCVMFEALTGRVPFLGDTSMETLTMQANAPPPAPSEFQDGISEELDAMVLTCLAKEPDERFQSMNELASGLQRLHEKRTERVQTEGEWQERRSSKSMVLPVVLALGLIVPLIAWFALQTVNTSSEDSAPKKGKKRESLPKHSDEQDLFDKIDKVADDYVVTVQAGGGVQLVIARKMTSKDVAEIKRVIKERKVTQLCFNLAELNPALLEPFSTEMSLDLLMIDHNMFDEKMFEIISRMRNLRTICIAHASPVPTAGLARLKKLKYLASFMMPYARCQPDAIKEISQIKSLEFLNLAYCPIGKYQGEIGKLELLRSLNVRGTGCDDGIARFLPKLKELTNLTVSDNKGISGETLASVKDKPLGFLSVGSTLIRQPDLECIRHMPLQVLEVGRLGLDDSALRYFVGLKKLERLSIAHNKFTDKTLFRLAMMDTLRGVEVSGNPVTELGIKALYGKGREIVSDPKEPFPLGDEFSDVPVWNMPD